ncbi:MAG: PilN domain-containing protein [Solibacillus sp.]
MIPDINLLPPITKKSDRSLVVGWLIGLVTLLLLALFIWMYFDARNQVIELQAQEEMLMTQRNQLQQEYDTLISQNKESLEDSIAFVERVSYKVSPLIDATQNLLQEHTYLRSYAFSDTSLQVTVDFETMTAVSSYVEALENSPYFTDVQVGAILNFEVAPSELQKEENRFKEVPRYSVNLTIAIDMLYIALGGVEE